MNLVLPPRPARSSDAVKRLPAVGKIGLSTVLWTKLGVDLADGALAAGAEQQHVVVERVPGPRHGGVGLHAAQRQHGVVRVVGRDLRRTEEGLVQVLDRDLLVAVGRERPRERPDREARPSSTPPVVFCV